MQVGRDLGLDPNQKLREWEAAMPAAAVQTELIAGWNVLVWENPTELASLLDSFAKGGV